MITLTRPAARDPRAACSPRLPPRVRLRELGPPGVLDLDPRSGCNISPPRFVTRPNGLQILRENVNYSAEALSAMFGNRITPAQAQQVGRTDDHPANQQQIANIIYGGTWGLKNLGNTQPTDGWDFRGCYLLQHTGRDVFSRMSVKFGVPLASITDPSKVDARIILMMACEEWNEKGCNVLADRDDLDGVTRKINGGTNGLEKRAAWLAKVKKVIA